MEVSWRIDVWSLGMIAIFLFTNHSLWELMYGKIPFKNTMVSNITKDNIDLLYSRFPSIGDKEKSFLEGCLQVDDKERNNASELLRRSLFNTNLSTVYSNNLRMGNDTLNERFVELQTKLNELQEESMNKNYSMSKDLEEKLLDVHCSLTNEMERIRQSDGK